MLPAHIIATSIKSSRFMGHLRSKIRPGAPIATPSEYAEMRCPAVTMLICRLSATFSRMPIIPNSDMPRQNVVIASAIKLFFIALKQTLPVSGCKISKNVGKHGHLRMNEPRNREFFYGVL